MKRIDTTENENLIREVIVKYRGPKRKSPCFRKSDEVVAFIRKTLIDNSREQFIVLFLDTGHKVVSYSVAAIGGRDSCPVDLGGIFQKALIVGASAIIVAHNHPTGELAPSEADNSVTRELDEAGKVLKVKVLDHIIITSDEYLSFNEVGLL